MLCGGLGMRWGESCHHPTHTHTPSAQRDQLVRAREEEAWGPASPRSPLGEQARPPGTSPQQAGGGPPCATHRIIWLGTQRALRLSLWSHSP